MASNAYSAFINHIQTRMQVHFVQKWAKEKHGQTLKQAIDFVKGSRSCPDLLVKVFFYTGKNRWHGNYRNTVIHGSYATDRGMQSIITLKVSDRAFYDPSVLTEDERKQLNLKAASHGRAYREYSKEEMLKRFVELFAHEFKHYLDMRHLLAIDRQHFKHWEVRAKKFAEKQVALLEASTP